MITYEEVVGWLNRAYRLSRHDPDPRVKQEYGEFFEILVSWLKRRGIVLWQDATGSWLVIEY